TVSVSWREQKAVMQPITDDDGIKRCVVNCFQKVYWVNGQQGIISAEGSTLQKEEAAAAPQFKPITSIALPLFGTGRGGRSAKDFVPPMLAAFNDFLSSHPDLTLEDIYLCVYRATDVAAVKEEMDKVFKPVKVSKG